VTVRTPTATTLLVTKGAPEAVLARCVDVPADGLNACKGCSPTARGSSPSPPATRPG
jgi:hypothetical protein